jgi:hypothetical protein
MALSHDKVVTQLPKIKPTLGEIMKRLIVKALVLIMLALTLAMPAISYAYSEPPKIVTAVLNPGATSKTISIPQGYKAISANVVLQMSGVDKAKVSVLVGTEQKNLAWPGNASATIDMREQAAASTIPVSVLAAGALSYVVNIEITCIKTSQP